MPAIVPTSTRTMLESPAVAEYAGHPMALDGREPMAVSVRRALQEGCMEKLQDPATLAVVIKGQVKGQDAAVEWLCNFMAMAARRSQLITGGKVKRSMLPANTNCALLAGTTGSGKTHLLKVFCEATGLVYRVVNGSALTRAGWRGATLDDELKALADELDKRPGSMALVLIDEADKMACRAKGSDTPAAESDATWDLLKVLDGGVYTGHADKGDDAFQIDLDRCAFVLSGAFTGIEHVIAARLGAGGCAMGFGADEVASVDGEGDLRSQMTLADVQEWGYPSELCGRISQVHFMPSLGEEVLYSIVKDKECGLEGKYGLQLPEGVHLEITPAAAQALALDAAAGEYGARGLTRAICEQVSAAYAHSYERGQRYAVVLDICDGELERRIEHRGSAQVVQEDDARSRELRMQGGRYWALMRDGKDEEAKKVLERLLDSRTFNYCAFSGSEEMQELLTLALCPPSDGDSLVSALAADLVLCALNLNAEEYSYLYQTLWSVYTLVDVMDERKYPKESPFELLVKEKGQAIYFNKDKADLEDRKETMPYRPDALYNRRWAQLKEAFSSDDLAAARTYALTQILDIAFDPQVRAETSARIDAIYDEHGLDRDAFEKSRAELRRSKARRNRKRPPFEPFDTEGADADKEQDGDGKKGQDD